MLLFFIEVLDLIEVQHHAVHGVKAAQLGDEGFDIPGGGGGAVQAVQLFARPCRNNAGSGGFTHAGGPVEDEIGQGAALGDAAQQAVGPQQVLLADHFIEGLGADAIRKGCCHSRASLGGLSGGGMGAAGAPAQPEPAAEAAEGGLPAAPRPASPVPLPPF